MIGKLETAFQNIATIDLFIQTDFKDKEESYINDYWHYFLQSLDHLSPAYKDLVNNQTPTIIDKRLLLTARNGAEASALKKRLENEFKVYCEKIGAASYSIEVEVKEDAANLEKFREEKALEDQQIAIKTVQDQQRRDESNAEYNQNKPFVLGNSIPDEPLQMEEILDEERRVTVQGYVFSIDIRKLRSGRSLLIAKATDYSDSLEIKMFSRNDEDEQMFDQAKEGMWIKARGRIQTDMYTSQLTMMANDIKEVKVELRQDQAETGKKRVELHAHTTMSQLDAVVAPGRLIEQAAKWGHEAIAITDHVGVQGFPEAHMASKKHDIKVLYGLEANVVDDGIPIVYHPKDLILDEQTYVVFDVETTGLSPVYDVIIEIAGVKIHQGEIIDRFESFANPHRQLSDTIINITGITDDLLIDAPEVGGVLKQFHDWVGDCPLVAHNATFDISFLNQGYEKIDYPHVTNTYIDTLELARFLLPQLGNHRLNTLCKHFNVELVQHHRAIYDAEATGYLMWKLVQNVLEKDIVNHNQLNNHMGEGNAYQQIGRASCREREQACEGGRAL